MKKYVLGNSQDRMPGFAFKLMAFFLRLSYIIKPVSKYLETFGIQEGDIVVDFGCGPGAHSRVASGLVGANGTVYAVDIHPMALRSVEKMMKKHNLNNVITAVVEDNRTSIPENIADLIFALDMFHMVSDPKPFLAELRRILKPGGVLIIEDGHQPRALSRKKILGSGYWKIQDENRKFMKCIQVE
jgi:ubiquinone/menaquinone biosynthesis C-methylase UbiE